MSEIIVKKIHRSKRRTIALIINTNAELIIRAPFLTSDRKIYNFIHQKQQWILAKQKYVKERMVRVVPRKFEEGEDIIVLGNAYKIKIVNNKNIKLSEYFEFPKKYLKNPEIHLTNWYKKIAVNYIKERCDYFVGVMNLKYKSLKIGSARKKLGSCTLANDLNFTWRLMIAPQAVVDYVVVHELSHVMVKNHSANFWKIVNKYCPKYMEYRKWLRDNHVKLN